MRTERRQLAISRPECRHVENSMNGELADQIEQQLTGVVANATTHLFQLRSDTHCNWENN
jgi:hypothetical protein